MMDVQNRGRVCLQFATSDLSGRSRRGAWKSPKSKIVGRNLWTAPNIIN